MIVLHAEERFDEIATLERFKDEVSCLAQNFEALTYGNDKLLNPHEGRTEYFGSFFLPPAEAPN